MPGKRVITVVKFTTGTTIEDKNLAKENCEALLASGLEKAELGFSYDIVGTHVEDL